MVIDQTPAPVPSVPRLRGPAALLRRGAPLVAVIGVIAVVAAVAGGGGGGGTSGERRDRPSTSAAASGLVLTDAGLPITSAAAEEQGLDLHFGDTCDPGTGRVAIPSIAAPPCVQAVDGSNGGSTSPGVTGDTITVALYLARPDPAVQALLRANGLDEAQADVVQTYRDYAAIHQATYETWGRAVEIVEVEASGVDTDDAAARADAERVADEVGAFASWGGPARAPAYAEELAARGVVCIACEPSPPNDHYLDHAPYLWGLAPPPEQSSIVLAEYVGKQLAGRPARFAGDGALRGRERAFALVHHDLPEPRYTGSVELFEQQLGDYGVTLADRVPYLLDADRAAEQATTIVARLQAAGVTSVIFAGDPLMPIFLTREATAQGYFPEWIVTGSHLTDTTVLGRRYDPAQWANAFGVSHLPARVRQEDDPAHRLHRWWWGREPASAGYRLIAPVPALFFLGVHLAGPDLTPARFRDALFSSPPVPGSPTSPQVSFGQHGLFETDDYAAVDDSAEVWWDAGATGVDELGVEGTGMMRHAGGGQRWLPGDVPEGEPAAFAEEGSVTVVEALPADQQPPDYPSPPGSPAAGGD